MTWIVATPEYWQTTARYLDRWNRVWHSRPIHGHRLMPTEAADRSSAQRRPKILVDHVPCEATLSPTKNYWLATFILQCRKQRACHTIKGVESLWRGSQYSPTDMSLMSFTELLGTRSHSWRTSESMLSGSKHLGAKRSKKRSANCWKNNMCISAGSCPSRTYCLAQGLLTSEYRPFLSPGSYM